MNCTVVVIIERPWKERIKEKEDIFTLYVILCTLLGYYLFLQKIM